MSKLKSGKALVFYKGVDESEDASNDKGH